MVRQGETIFASFGWVSFGSAASPATPDIDNIVDVSNAFDITMQIDTTDSDNTSASTDIDVQSSQDGSTWDTVSWASALAVGDAITYTVKIQTGVNLIRLRADNNDAAALVSSPRVNLVVTK